VSERSRTTIYQQFEPLLGEKVVGEMLSYFPARDVEEPATKEFVRAELAELRAAMHDEFRRQLQWLVVTLLAIGGMIIGALRLFL
jgi:hypothetical protein